MCALGRHAEVDLLEVAVVGLDACGQSEWASTHLRGQLQSVGVLRQAEPAQGHRPGRRDPLRELCGRTAREIVPPAVEAREDVGWNSEDRGPGGRARLARVADQAHDRIGAGARTQRPVVGERGRFQDVLALGVVLLQREVERHREGRLVLLVADERRAVRGGEESEPEADHEEGDCRRAASRVPSEGKTREPDREAPSPGRALQETERGPEHSHADDGGHEHDEPGEEQEHHSCSLTAGQGLRIGASPGQRENDGRQRAGGGDVEQADAGTARPGSRPERREQQESNDQGDDDGRHEPPARHDRVRQNRPGRRACSSCQRRASGGSGGPAQERARQGDRSRLSSEDEGQLPARGAVPDQPARGSLGLTRSARGGEEDEGQQQGSRFASDQEQSAAGDAGRVARRLDLVHGTLERKEVRARTQAGACLLDARRERAHLPRVDVPGLERHDPGIRPIRVLDQRKA